jgi:uncharacterized protein YndB with AHSA1/START domain
MPTNTIRLHRVLHAPRERHFRTFLEPDAIAFAAIRAGRR